MSWFGEEEDKGSPFFIVVFWIAVGVATLISCAAVCSGGYIR